MTCTVDSAQVVGGAMRLQWTLANDSLSRLVAPHLYRRTGITTTDLGVAWPDSSRRVAIADGAISSGATTPGTSAGRRTPRRHHGAVTRTIGAP